MKSIKLYITEEKHRIVDHFYFWFGTDDYYNNKEPKLFYDKWICNSVEWRLFNNYEDAITALNKSNNRQEER